MKRRRDERGAIAVMAALVIALFLLVVSAFAIDFGNAYVSKRQLQTAADSSALAAGAVYAKKAGSCASLIADVALKQEAQVAADDYRQRNRPGSTGSTLTPSCDADNNLEVSYTAAGDTDQTFGSLATGGSKISTDRSAAAMVDVPPAIKGKMRPLALCSAQFPAGPYGTGAAETRVDYPGGGHAPPASCPQPSTPGNWWLLDCPGERTGSADQLAEQVRNGCPDTVSVVEGQEDAETPEQLSLILSEECPTAPERSESCLSGNPGNISQGQVGSAWQSLIDRGDRFYMPIFCVPPTCATGSISGTGTNAVVPVFKVAAMQLCGYHFSKNDKYARTSSPQSPCTVATGQALMSDDTQDNYLVIAPMTAMTSGSTNDVGTCAIGETCDGGARRVVLSQ